MMRDFNAQVIKDFVQSLREVCLEQFGNENVYPVTFPAEDLVIPSLSYSFQANQTPNNKANANTDYIMEVWTLTKDYNQSVDMMEALVKKFNGDRRFFMYNAEDNYSPEFRAYSIRVLFSTNMNSM